MSNPTWPATLPQTPFGNDNSTYTPGDNILRTQMEGGPDKVRRRFTAVPETLTVMLKLSPAQRATLRGFLKDTLSYVLPFTWVDFRTGAAATYRLADKGLPHEQYLGADDTGTWWQVQFTLELMPGAPS